MRLHDSPPVSLGALRSRTDVYWVVTPLIIAAALRFYNLSDNSIWFDEALSIKQARLPFIDMIEATSYFPYPPLHNIFLFFSFRLFGITEFAARLPSVLFDLGTVGLVFQLGRRLFGTHVGLIASLFIAFSSFHISYAQEARMYAAYAFFATLSIYMFISYLDKDTHYTRLVYIGSTALLLYTHFYAVFVVAAENLFMLYLLCKGKDGVQRRLVNWLLMQIVILILFAPLLPTLIDGVARLSKTNSWIPRPSLEVFHRAFRTIAGGQISLLLGLVALTGIAKPSLSTAEIPSAPRMEKNSFVLGYWDKISLLALWCSMPVLMPFMLSFFMQPFFISRYTIGASPAWQIAVAVGLCNWCNDKRLPAAAATLVLLAAMLPAAIKAYSPPWKPNWRDAVAFLDERVPRGGSLVFPVGWERQPYLFYTRRDDIRVVASAERIPTASDDAEIWVVSARKRRLCKDNPQFNPKFGAVVEHHRFDGIGVCSYRARDE